MTPLEKLKAKRQAIAEAKAMISPKQLKGGKNDDDSAYFKLVGGPYHDQVVRLYPPWEVLKFNDGTTYEIHPPLNKRTDRWVYVHAPETREDDHPGE